MTKKISHPITILLIGIMLFAVKNAQSAENEAKRPNILFFITDDQFKHMMNFLPEGEGKNLTPHTDALVAESTIMDQQYVTSPVCTPSRFASLTGLYPSRSQAAPFLSRQQELGGQASVEWNTFITEGMKTLPKILRDAGYRTGIVGKNHVVHVRNIETPEWLADPYDEDMLALLERNRQKQVASCKEAGFDYAASLYHSNPNAVGVKALVAHNLDWIAKGALDFLDMQDERPFFLYCAVTVPHGPNDAERSWNADPRITAEGMLDEPLDVMPARETIPQRLQEAGITDSSRASLLWLDDMLGALVAKLKETGQYDNTVILYFNDHGQKSKGTVYEGGVHSESFIRRPGGFPVGPRSDAKVSNIDFTPTLLSLAGIDYSEEIFDGVSFLPVLEKKQEKVRDDLFFELGFVRGMIRDNWKYVALRYPQSVLDLSREERQSILDKFNARQEKRGGPIFTQDPMQPFSHVQVIPGGGWAEQLSMGMYPGFYDADQLYNIDADPNEQTNLASNPEYAGKLDEMKQAMIEHLGQMPGSFGDLKPGS